ncbi:hypothetical protein GCM10009739_03820 [Microbacterium ulmi]
MARAACRLILEDQAGEQTAHWVPARAALVAATGRHDHAHGARLLCARPPTQRSDRESSVQRIPRLERGWGREAWVARSYTPENHHLPGKVESSGQRTAS